MKIDQGNCVQCERCLPYCPVEAIKYDSDSDTVFIEKEECVECYVCYNNNICPTDAFETTELKTFIEKFKHLSCDPTSVAAKTGVAGRGTEEVKANDFTKRVTKGEVGVCIDMGRPGVGCYLRDVEKVAKSVLEAGLKLGSEDENPLIQLIEDKETGKFKEEYLDEFVLSTIVEGKIEVANLEKLLKKLREVETEIDTVFSLGLILENDQADKELFENTLNKLDIPIPKTGKVNMGFAQNN